jgi:hypothetical protein
MNAKGFGAAGFALVCTFVAGSAVGAEEPSNFRVTLGVKAWLNEWQSWFTPNNPGANVIASTTKATVALIPTGSIRYRDVFVSAGYFATTNYDFPKFTEAVGGATVETTATAERTELDVNFGWYFIPRAAVTLGYKQVKQDFTSTTTGGPFSGQPVTTRWLYTAPTVGVAGAAPLTESVALYGNAAYGPVAVVMNGKDQPDTKGSYSSSEFGIAWQAKNSIITLAYKYQIVQQEQSGAYAGLRLRDVSSGWILGALLSF